MFGGVSAKVWRGVACYARRPAPLHGVVVLAFGFVLLAVCPAAAADEFSDSIRPVLDQHCSACHDPGKKASRVDFLKATTTADISQQRSLWRNVATQLRNRTMPPAESPLTEQDRFRVSSWINEQLRLTACDLGESAGIVTLRRLTRRDYGNTIRDMMGVNFAVEDLFPADGSGGEGFDTNGETLFVPPLMMERYLDAAEQILSRAIVSPPFERSFAAEDMQPAKPAPVDEARRLEPGERISEEFLLYNEADYNFLITVDRARLKPVEFVLEIDGEEAERFTMDIEVFGSATSRQKRIHLARGPHRFALKVSQGSDPLDVFRVEIAETYEQPSAAHRALHYGLLGLEPGESPLQPRKTVGAFLTRLLRQAYRRPASKSEVDLVMRLYDRSAERGDPFEESVKLALKAVLVSPDFLFRVEEAPSKPGLHPLTDHELAVRLSYFLWSTAPDAELQRLADEARLQDPGVLRQQVDRLLDHPRSRIFARTFMGQWLGTKDVGGRVAPTVNEIQHYYTPRVAADMREEPVVLFHHILDEDRSVLELIDSDYAFLTERLARFYQVEDQVDIRGNGFQRINWADDRRGGVLGLGAVLAMTSHFQQNSPVLRGAWVLETLLGTPVPSPPPDIPALETGENDESGLSIREKLLNHREDVTCAACHDLIDPIGFGLENFDWLGRWRETAEDGKPVNTHGVLPSGESFDSPAELRRVLLSKKDEFLRNFVRKVLGYALGRSLDDADQCLVQRLADRLGEDDYRARTLIREVVLSTPFRYKQGPAPDQVASAGDGNR